MKIKSSKLFQYRIVRYNLNDKTFYYMVHYKRSETFLDRLLCSWQIINVEHNLLSEALKLIDKEILKDNGVIEKKIISTSEVDIY